MSPRDGWLNPAVLFAGIQAGAGAGRAGVVPGRVAELAAQGGRVRGVQLAQAGLLEADAVMVCAGTWTPQLVAPLGMTLPIEPMRRHEHYVTASATANDLPFVKDVNGLAIHAHDGGFSIGLVDFDHPGGEGFSVDDTYFTPLVEPAT